MIIHKSQRKLLILLLVLSSILFGNPMINKSEIAHFIENATLDSEKHIVDAKAITKAINDKKTVSSERRTFMTEQSKKLNDAFAKQGKPNYENDKLLVLVSFAMPKESIRELLIQAEQYNAVLVIQGLVENSLPKTINKITEFVKETKNVGGISIDPNIFERFGVKRVPAYLIKSEKEFDVLYGADGVKSALETFSNSNTRASAIAKRILKNA